jgi:hypothetical protein
MPALLRQETNRLNKLAAWLMTSRKVEEGVSYGQIIQPLFRLAAMEVCMWPDQLKRSGIYEGILSSIRGVIEPSDGHPQEELTPDFGWFRPLSFNNSTWVLYWPDLEV